MDKFKSLFGMDRDQVRRTVVLLPFIPAGALAALGIKTLASGAVFASASNETLTVIRAGAGASFTGDAVLYLADSPAEQVLFLGTCGLINPKSGLMTGSLLVPSAAYAMESFSDIIDGRLPPLSMTTPDGELLSTFCALTGLGTQRTSCVSFGSLYLEDDHLSLFRKIGADVIDMECAALFNAGRKVRKPVLALLAVADIPGEKNFYEQPSPGDKKSLADAVNQACKAISLFANHHGT